MSTILRPYQSDTIEKVKASVRRGVQRPAAVAATAAGKTTMFAHMLRDVVAAGHSAAVLAHRAELLDQAAAELRAVAPHVRSGIVQGTRNGVHGRDVLIASTPTLASPRRMAAMLRHAPRFVVVDECHHYTSPVYRRVLEELGAFRPGGPITVGFTATMARGDRQALGEVWQEIVAEVGIRDLIRQGYLLRVRGVRVKIKGLDLRKVKRRAGDFSDSALGEALHEALAPAAIVRAYREHADGRSALAFVPTVAFAEELAQAFRDAGVTAARLDGKTPTAERKRILEASARGQIKVVTNVGVCTEGTNMPHVDVIIMARPTSSTTLYVQCVGRGLRLYPGQTHCLVLDVVGVTGKHRLATPATLDGAPTPEDLDDDLITYEDEDDDEIELPDTPLDEFLDAEPTSVGGADGPLDSQSVDLFSGSPWVWLRTHRGVWFLDLAGEYVAITPDSIRGTPGRYSVAVIDRVGAGGRWAAEGVDLSTAFAFGEAAADDVALTLPHSPARSAEWRDSPVLVTQRRAGESLGVAVHPLMTRGQAADALSIHQASDRIDALPIVGRVSVGGYW